MNDDDSQRPTPEQQKACLPLFTELGKFIAIRDYRQVLKVANKILHSDGFRSNFKLAKCKCAALIKMARYEETVKFIRNDLGENKDLKMKLAYEHSYSLYRAFKNDEALQVLIEVEENCQIADEDVKNKLNELKAQILYRLEQFSEAKNLYKTLIRNCADDLEEDREINLLACEAALSLKNGKLNHNRPGSKPKVKMTKLSATMYEAFYNRAIIHIGNGDFSKAEKSLNNAKAELENYDDFEPEELDQEVQPILAQLALVKQKQGLKNEALKAYQSVLKSNPNQVLSTVVHNNILSINQTQNLFDNKKKVKWLQVQDSELTRKLQSSQIFTMALNKILVSIHADQLNVAKELLDFLDQNSNIDKSMVKSDDVILAKLALLLKTVKSEKNDVKALPTTSQVENILKNAGDAANFSDRLDLAQVQLTKNVEIFKETSYPGLIAYQLKSNAKNPENQVKILENILPKIDQSEPEGMDKYFEYSKILAKIYENPKIKNLQKAMDVYKYLCEIDEAFLPDFIRISAKLDPAASENAANKLEPTENLIKGIDIAALEDSAGVVGSRYARKLNKDENTIDEENSEKPKKKRKRTNKPAKNMDRPLDNERWLPLKDRSYYRGKRGMNRKKKMTGAQGAAGMEKVADKLDASKASFNQPVQASSSSKNNKNKSKAKSKKGKRR